MDKEQAAEKLKKIKALAERGVGGEKETAMRMYRELMEKYQIEEAEVLEDYVSLHWFGYKTELEEDLLTQIFYKVTGSCSTIIQVRTNEGKSVGVIAQNWKRWKSSCYLIFTKRN